MLVEDLLWSVYRFLLRLPPNLRDSLAELFVAADEVNTYVAQTAERARESRDADDTEAERYA